MIGVIFVVSPFWQLLLLAAIAATLLFPVHRWLLSKIRFKSTIAASIIYILLLMLVVIPVVVALLIIGNQTSQLVLLLEQLDGTELENFKDDFVGTLGLDLNNINEQAFVRQIENWLGFSLNELINWFGQFIRNNLATILTAIAQAVGDIIGSAISLFISFIMFSFFFVVLLLNHDRLRAFIITLSPLESNTTGMYLRRVRLMIRDVMLGVVGMAVIQTLIMWFVLVILDIPFAGVLAIFFVHFCAHSLSWNVYYHRSTGDCTAIHGGMAAGFSDMGRSFNYYYQQHRSPVATLYHFQRTKCTSSNAGGWLRRGVAVFGVIGLFLGPIVIILFTTSLELYLENYGQTAISTSAGEHAKSNGEAGHSS